METIFSKKTFVLNEGRDVAAQPDVTKWALWLDWAVELGVSVVKQEEAGGAWISTVFLGFDMNHLGNGGPILFETCVFRKDGSEFVRRYRTWAEAEVGHADLVDIARICGPRDEPKLDMEEICRIAGNLNEPLRETPRSE